MEGLWKWGEGGDFCVFVWFFWFALPRPKRGEGGGLFFFFFFEERRGCGSRKRNGFRFFYF
jgi:hypothetical protein